MKRACVSVTNDLATDQRVLKVCNFLTRLGYSVTMVGVKRPKSLSIDHFTFKTFRFRMIFQKGFMFYAEYNLKLFFFLLFRRCNLYVSNDLDTLLPNFLVSRTKFTPLVYDSHEYFLGSTEIVERPFVRSFWHTIEKMIFPRLKNVITVNHSIADLYEKEYGKRPEVVRNLPRRYRCNPRITRRELGLPPDKKIILMQGGAINLDRGAEELIHAMKPAYGLENVELYFIGGGDVWEKIKELVKLLHLERTVHFLPKMPYKKMMEYTCLSDLGVSLDKPVSMNYKYSLPNKLFDYLAAGVPVLASPLVEVKNVVEGYDVGMCIENHEPAHLAEKIKEMLSDEERYNKWKKNALAISEQLCWENEEKVLAGIYGKFV
ncbi:MAG: glycosyltransferase [Bacteroidetes bacterium]|nr:MAG: glycosyltransferase [Bacteroidota bacterium]